MAEEAPPAKRLARVGSFSGVWWKLGDAAGDTSSVERRLRAIADEEADVRARIRSRQAAARGVRRNMALASLALEAAAFVYAYWTARRRRSRRVEKKKVLLLPLLAVPALSTVVFAAFARFQKMFDARDEKKLEKLAAERKSKMRGSHHNMQMLLHKYDPDAAGGSKSNEPAAAAAAAAAAKLKRTHSRLSFHIGDE